MRQSEWTRDLLQPDVCSASDQLSPNLVWFPLLCGYNQVDLCRPWNESQRPVLPRCLTLSQQMPTIKHVAGDTFVFNKTTLHLIVPRTPLNCYIKHPRTSLVLISGHQTTQTWIQWIIRSGVLCSRQYMNVVRTVSMSWSSASLKSGTVCSITLLTRLSTSGESDWERACMRMDKVLSIYCERVWMTKVTEK